MVSLSHGCSVVANSMVVRRRQLLVVAKAPSKVGDLEARMGLAPGPT